MEQERPRAAGPSLKLLWWLALVPVTLFVAVGVLSAWYFMVTSGSADSRLSALWVLMASLLAATGAWLAALLSATSAERDRIAADAAGRATEEEARRNQSRQVLEATLEGVRLLHESPNQMTAAGALAVVIELGYHSIALRILDPALQANSVNAGTAGWVLNKALTQRTVTTMSNESAKEPSESTVRYCAYLMIRYPGSFTEVIPPLPGSDAAPTIGAGWPFNLYRTWPPYLSVSGTNSLVQGLLQVLLHHPRSYWGTFFFDFLDTLLHAYRTVAAAEPESQNEAGSILREILTADADVARAWAPDPKISAKLKNQPIMHVENQSLLRRWLAGEAVPVTTRTTNELGQPSQEWVAQEPERVEPI